MNLHWPLVSFSFLRQSASACLLSFLLTCLFLPYFLILKNSSCISNNNSFLVYLLGILFPIFQCFFISYLQERFLKICMGLNLSVSFFLPIPFPDQFSTYTQSLPRSIASRTRQSLEKQTTPLSRTKASLHPLLLPRSAGELCPPGFPLTRQVFFSKCK